MPSDDKPAYRNPFVREAKFIGILIVVLGSILVVAMIFGPGA